MDAKKPAVLPTAGATQLQPEDPVQNAPSEFSTTVTVNVDALPGYSEVVKEMPPVGTFPGQPQLMYIQPGAFIQPVNMNSGTPGSAKEYYYASHNFLILSAITSILCGICSIATLTCTIPAIIFSILSENNRSRGAYQTATRYGNCSLTFNVIAIVSGFIVAIVALGVFLGLTFQDCALATRCPGGI